LFVDLDHLRDLDLVIAISQRRLMVLLELHESGFLYFG
jgi:hypothetical protein